MKGASENMKKIETNIARIFIITFIYFVILLFANVVFGANTGQELKDGKYIIGFCFYSKYNSNYKNN